MSRLLTLLGVLVMSMGLSASWYWPFGSDEESSDEPRLSQLMGPATELIDEASDLAEAGKIQESVEKYRAALQTLDEIEANNPERAKTQEFSTVRNKRAYVNAAIDSLLLSQAKQNARAVAVSDTTELEKKLAEERAARRGEKPKAKTETKAKSKAEAEAKEMSESKAESKVESKADATVDAKVAKPVQKEAGARPAAGKDRVVYDIVHGDYDDAEAVIAEMLVEKPNDAVALNLKSAVGMSRGNLKAAESSLDQAIMSNPRDYHAYYNMALLLLKADPTNKTSAKRYYETGRAVGGPASAELEALVK